MTYVVMEHGRTVHPVDRDEAEQWQWDRVCTHRMRGRYWCRYTGLSDCPAPLRQCCELGERKVKPGWRYYRVTREEVTT